MNLIQSWYEVNFNMIERAFRSEIIHCPNYEWVRIEYFPLPEVYNVTQTKLLIKLPGSSGMENPQKYRFFLCKNLRRTDGVKMEHYFENSINNHLSHKGYAQLCFHLKSFHPSLNVLRGDNLVDICQALYNFLAQKHGV